MATLAEIETLRDWFIDGIALIQKQLDDLDSGGEKADVIARVVAAGRAMHAAGVLVVAGLDELLIEKKRIS